MVGLGGDDRARGHRGVVGALDVEGLDQGRQDQVASVSANWAPMQTRGPTPNGR